MTCDTRNVTCDIITNTHFWAYAWNKMSECQTKAGNQISLSYSLINSLSHSLIHSLSSYWTTFVFMSMLKSHSHTLSLSYYLTLSMSHSHTFTLSLSHSLTLHMLNNFCFHVYAQKCWVVRLSSGQVVRLSYCQGRSLGHAEQLLFSCLGSKVTVYSRKLQCFLVSCFRGLSIWARWCHIPA